MLEKLTVDDFTAAVGEHFALELNGAGTLNLELREARTIEPGAPATASDAHRSPFALELRGPSEPLLPQSTYRLEHDGVGPLEIFLVPVSRSADGVDYEAIFT